MGNAYIHSAVKKQTKTEGSGERDTEIQLVWQLLIRPLVHLVQAPCLRELEPKAIKQRTRNFVP